MSADIERLQVEVKPSLEFEGQQFFEEAAHVVSSTPSGWLGGSRHEATYGANDEVAPRVLVQDGVSGGILPFRGMYKSTEGGKLVDRFPTNTVDVAVFDKASSKREYGRAVYDRFGPIRLPFFETRVKHALRKAEKRVGRLATAAVAEA